MFDKEVLICPILEFRVEFRRILITYLLQLLMEIGSIRFIHIMRSQINTTTKPTDIFIQFKVPDIHMDNRYPRIVRVNHNGYTSGKEFLLVYAKCFLDLLRKLSMHSGEIYPTFFQYITMLDDSGPSASSTFTFPQFFLKTSLTIQCL